MDASISPPREVLEEPQWRERARLHLERVSPWTRALRGRRSTRSSHPVHDFLFTYYSYRPSQLEAWHPGAGFALRTCGAADGAPYHRNSRYTHEKDWAYLDTRTMPDSDRERIRWIIDLLASIESRPPQFGCSGLHEWAMVYGVSESEIRHESFPLRLSPEQIEDVVRSGTLTCTHYDAYRFFTKAARPLNAARPARHLRARFEQGGCLHNNMDLYKWAYKMSPWIGSDLIADAFLFAAEGRELDMRASPYDLRALGFEPICVESADGRHEYEREQRALAARAAPLRRRILGAARALHGGEGLGERFRPGGEKE